MTNPFFLVMLFFLVSTEGEIRIPEIPPAFPDTQQHTLNGDSHSAPKPQAFPAGKKTLPQVRSYTPARNMSDSAGWLLERMSVSDSPELRMRAAEAWPLSESDARGVQEIVEGLSDPDSMVRTGARQRLSEQNKALVFSYAMRTMVGGTIEEVKSLDAALPHLGATLGSYMTETLRTELETPQHRRIAAYCLGRMGMHNATEALAAHLWSQDTDLARACVDALALLLPPDSTPYWLELLEHSEPYFKTQAVRALAILGDPKSFDALKRIVLGETHPELQQEALRCISGYPPGMLYPVLIEIMEKNENLRAEAYRMLRGRTGLDLGWRPGPWREWLNTAAAGPTPPLVPSP